MEAREKPRVLSCTIKGPGPVYKLPTLIGYNNHDPSRHRGPAYSIRAPTGIKTYVMGPGPHYDIRNLTKSGPDNPPAYTIRGRKVWSLRDHAPGPGAYSPELCPPMNHNRRAPAYSIKSRGITKFLDEGPGPNSYLLPTCIGPRVPDKSAQGAFSIIGHRKTREEIVGPGPAAYIKINYDTIKRRSPAYSLKGRHILENIYHSPAPIFYPLYDTRKRSPMYSFGIKHSECTGIPMTQLDEE
ncbi:PREDICTED: outer dense fiber protein 3-like [Vollenhovia emeryi]|uniref:outer dense fiber protein 3-like n=1 Tax=Vollenhovia emeryi TaxID=411798 RepID=UPI0005F406A3|nr:PREDICTED: outer dense fiber protein 3-like [Vollenhovia emeryi]